MALKKICACGCEQPTGATFAVGHDSRYVSSRVASALAAASPEEVAAVRAAVEALSAKLAGKFDKNFARALERKNAPATPRAPRPVKTRKVPDEASRERAARLVEKLASMHLTGQLGTYTGPAGESLAAKVMGRNADGTLRLRVGWGPGKVQDLASVAPGQFTRHQKTIIDDEPATLAATA